MQDEGPSSGSESSQSYQPDSDASSSTENSTGSEDDIESELNGDNKRVKKKDGNGKQKKAKAKKEKKVSTKKIKNATNRGLKKCPLPLCGASVIHLPHHLQNVHGWSPEHSRTAVARFGMRKSYTFSDSTKVPQKKAKKSTDDKEENTNDKKRKDYHKHRYCPVDGCTSLVKRIPAHLRNVHKLDPNAKEYKDLLSRVRGPVKESQMRPYHERPRATKRDEASVSLTSESSFHEVVTIDDEEQDQQDESDIGEASHIESSDIDPPEFTVQFKAWLNSADGGNLDDKTSEQHGKQISKLLKVIDSKQEMASLFNSNIINDKFLEGFAKHQYHPKTTKSYLTSLRHFYSFALSNDFGVNISKEQILSVKEKVTRWSSSFRKGCSKRRWEKMEEDLHALITPKQIAEFERSQAARNAICLFGQLSGAHCLDMTQANYTLTRDFLLVQISIDNANRAGVLANMNMGQLNSAVKHDDEYVVHVSDQKTFATHGPARIVLSQKLYSWMAIFVREARSKVTSLSPNPSSNVFLTWNGEPMVSSQINKAIKSVWKKAQVGGNPSSTLLRKSAVSQVHTASDSNEARENLADLMAHNLQTANKYYRLQEKSKSSVQAYKQLRNIMRQQSDNPDQTLKAKPNSISVSLSPSASEAVVPKTSKRSWKEDKEALIKAVFKDEIEREAITLATVKAKISDQPQLREEDPKRVMDKVRAQWRFSKASSPEPQCLPSEVETLEQRVERVFHAESETSSEIIPPTSVSSSVRNVFTATELDRMKKLFRNMIEQSYPISKPQIQTTLEKEDWGVEMLKKVSLDTIVNRLKYERRQVRASEMRKPFK